VGASFQLALEIMPVLMGRIGSPAAACSSPADFDVTGSTGMVSQLSQSKFTGSCACLRPAPQHLESRSLPSHVAWQDAMRSTSKLRLPRKNDTMSCFS
jgi:hypothetical protein